MPDTLNPTADDQYVATNQRRADVATVQDGITRIEALRPDEKRQAIANHGWDAGQYAQLKQSVSYPLNQDDRDALEAQRQNIEGGAPASSTPRPQTEPPTGTVVNNLSDRWTNFWKEAGVKEGEQIPDPSDPEFDAKMGKLSETLLNSVAASQPDVAVAGGEASGLVSQLIERVRKHFGPEAGKAAGEAAAHAPDAASVAADAVPPEGGEGPRTIPTPVGEASEAATTEPAEPLSAGVTPAVEHSDVAAIQHAAAQPMSKDEFEKIEFSGADAEHPDLKSPLLWTDRFRAMEYGGQLADNAIAARKQFAISGSDEDKALIETADKEMNDALPRAYAIRHETGLALQKLGASPGAQQLKAVFEAMAENVGMPVRLSSALAKLPTVAERSKLLDDAAGMSGEGWTKSGALYKLYVNSILSFNSVGKKAVSDAANILFQVPARALAAGISDTSNLFGSDFFKGESGESVDLGEAHAMARGMIDNFGSALKTGLDSAREGKPMFEGDVGFLDNPGTNDSLMGSSGYEGTWWGRAIDYYGHLVSVPGRSIIAVDQFSKSMQFNMELEALAHRQGMVEAAGEGLAGAEQSARASELAESYIKKPAGWMTDQAMASAKINTFQQDLEGSLAKADAFRKSSYLTRTLMPFFKTPVNITLQGIRQSPLAPLSGVWRRTVAGGGPEAAIAMSKTALGSAIAAYLTYHVLKGNITGGVPANLKGTMRDDWLHDHEPFSIKSGDGNWHSYGGFEPMSWLLGTVADAAPAWSYMEQGDADRAVGQLGQAVVNEINRQPMWGALHMLVHALDDVDKGRSTSIGEVGSRMVAGLVPSMAANLAGGIDPVRRQTQGVFEEIRNRIPFLKEDGLPTLDSFGRPVIVPPGFMANEFPAYVSTTKKPDPVVDEMIRLKNAVGFEPPQVGPSVGPHISADADDQNAQDAIYGAKATPAELNRWLELRNNPGKKYADASLYDKLAKLIQDPKYQALSDSAQANEWHRQFSGYQQLGKQALLDENESVRGRMLAAYVGRGKARTQGRPAGGVAKISAP